MATEAFACACVCVCVCVCVIFYFTKQINEKELFAKTRNSTGMASGTDG